MPYDRVLVTGGLGFIGSVVSERFLQQGSEVTVLDSMISNVIEPESLLDRYPKARVVFSSVEEFFTDGAGVPGHDLVIHAASFVGPASIVQYQGAVGHSIVSDAAKIIKACLAWDIPLVFISSAEVYGRSGILSEDSEIRVPPYYNARIEYALAKLTSEAMVVNSHAQGLRAVVVRPFNVAGPRQSRAGGFVMPTFVQQALGNKPLTVFGTGMQKRAFLGVRDLADFFAGYVADGTFDTPKIYNVGNPKNATTIEDLARRIIELLDSKSQIVHVNPQSVYGPLYYEAESFEKLPDISNASALGWSPKQGLDEIILETAEFYRHNRDTRGADARS